MKQPEEAYREFIELGYSHQEARKLVFDVMAIEKERERVLVNTQENVWESRWESKEGNKILNSIVTKMFNGGT